MKIFQKEKKCRLFEFIGKDKTCCVNMSKVDLMEVHENVVYLYIKQTKWQFPFDDKKTAFEMFEKLKGIM